MQHVLLEMQLVSMATVLNYGILSHLTHSYVGKLLHAVNPYHPKQTFPSSDLKFLTIGDISPSLTLGLLDIEIQTHRLTERRLYQ